MKKSNLNQLLVKMFVYALIIYVCWLIDPMLGAAAAILVVPAYLMIHQPSRKRLFRDNPKRPYPIGYDGESSQAYPGKDAFDTQSI